MRLGIASAAGKILILFGLVFAGGQGAGSIRAGDSIPEANTANTSIGSTLCRPPKVDSALYLLYLYHFERRTFLSLTNQLTNGLAIESGKPVNDSMVLMEPARAFALLGFYGSQTIRGDSVFVTATVFHRATQSQLAQVGTVLLNHGTWAEIHFPLISLPEIALLNFVDSIDHHLEPKLVPTDQPAGLDAPLKSGSQPHYGVIRLMLVGAQHPDAVRWYLLGCKDSMRVRTGAFPKISSMPNGHWSVVFDSLLEGCYSVVMSQLDSDSPAINVSPINVRPGFVAEVMVDSGAIPEEGTLMIAIDRSSIRFEELHPTDE